MLNRILFFLALTCFLFACSDNSAVLPKEPTVKISRFDKLVLTDAVDRLRDEFPVFSNLYFSNIIEISNSEKDSISEELNLFLDDEFIKALNNKVDSVYKDLDDIERQLSLSFDLYKQKLDPDFNPSMYTFTSGLVYQTILFDDNGKDGIGIGLDMFLGESFPYVSLSSQNPAFSDYIIRAFNKEHLPKKIMENLILDQMGDVKGNRLLDYMIYNGKKKYILEQLMPYVQDSVIIEYSEEELLWSEENQQDIWSHFFREELFFETDMRKINKLILPSPNSPGMPDVAPGRTANFIGWQVVKQFMQRYPNTSLRELMSMNDNQGILDKSKYKPR